MVDDTTFGFRHFFDFEKIAFVSDDPTFRSLVQAFGMMMPAEVRTFPVDDLDEAKDVAGGRERPATERSQSGQQTIASRPIESLRARIRGGQAMFTRIEDLPAGAIGFVASGRITADDRQSVLEPTIDGRLEAGGRVRLLYVAGPDFAGYDRGGLYDDAVFGTRHFTAFREDRLRRRRWPVQPRRARHGRADAGGACACSRRRDRHATAWRLARPV